MQFLPVMSDELVASISREAFTVTVSVAEPTGMAMSSVSFRPTTGSSREPCYGSPWVGAVVVRGRITGHGNHHQ